MNRRSLIFLAVFSGLALVAADKPVWLAMELEDVEIRARLVRDAEEIAALVGGDLDREFILVELEVKPLYNTNVILTREDFELHAFRNNERSSAASPDQVAGESVLVLGKGQVTRSGGVFSESREPVIVGGAPGTGTQPKVLGNPSNRGIGGGTSSTVSIETEAETRSAATLLDRLGQQELPMGETRTTVRGYLYFQVNPKHGPKTLSLNYDGSAGESRIAFK